MKPIFLLYFFGGLLLLGCGTEASNEVATQEVVGDSLKIYGNTEFPFPTLSSEVEEALLRWSDYQDFQGDIQQLNGNALNFLRPRTELLANRADSLLKDFPDSIFGKPIHSRMVIVNTRIKLLNQAVQRSRPDTVKVAYYVSELNKALQSLMIQLNEKYQKEAIDEQRREDELKELEKQQRFLDSVYQQELKDNNDQNL
ncbi:hypothetical protein [Altibacter sp. HG106]|uniref:hypothetical protein n=1 Tax=Altibacter sp. HG106 TaxID=3023937 RepID=UPI00235065F4|nr:hypothetical protein [Altibacter sp. HG106]MDC7995106.1 hypothetical protein [Altibacter sp. HG106]